MSILYSTDGEGRWTRTEWKPQCAHEGMFFERCQGTAGHQGHHWAYSPDGSYNYEENEDDPATLDEFDAGGAIPPGHPFYIQPIDKAKDYYMEFREQSEVTDPAEIERLERDDIRDGESVTRPVEWGSDFDDGDSE